MERGHKTNDQGCAEVFGWIAANLIAPAAALPGAMFVTWMVQGSGSALEALLEAAASFVTAPFTTVGLVAYAIAFLPCVVAGTTMMAFASVWPVCRGYAAWAAAGALLGALIGLALGLFTFSFVWASVGAGVACALVYRLIIGFALPVVEQANPPPPPAAF